MPSDGNRSTFRYPGLHLWIGLNSVIFAWCSRVFGQLVGYDGVHLRFGCFVTKPSRSSRLTVLLVFWQWLQHHQKFRTVLVASKPSQFWLWTCDYQLPPDGEYQIVGFVLVVNFIPAVQCLSRFALMVLLEPPSSILGVPELWAQCNWSPNHRVKQLWHAYWYNLV